MGNALPFLASTTDYYFVIFYTVSVIVSISNVHVSILFICFAVYFRLLRIILDLHVMFCSVSSIRMHIITCICWFFQVRSMRYWIWYSRLLSMWSSSFIRMLPSLANRIWNTDHWHYVYCHYLLHSWCETIYYTKYSYHVVSGYITSWYFTKCAFVSSAWRLVQSICSTFLSEIVRTICYTWFWRSHLSIEISRTLLSWYDMLIIDQLEHRQVSFSLRLFRFHSC
jgi:hypothetical protein